MFVRFRPVRHRLVVNLVTTRREGGKIRSAHIARLGSVALPEPISVGERLLFWRDLKERWRGLIDRLGNRVTADDRKKALAAIHARIPKPSEAEEQAMRVDAMRNRVKAWERLGASTATSIESDRELIATTEQSIAKEQALADEAAKKAHRARMFTLKLSDGDRLDGDDDLALDYVAGIARKRDRQIREAPRPAARGRRGRQKRPRWSKVAENA